MQKTEKQLTALAHYAEKVRKRTCDHWVYWGTPMRARHSLSSIGRSLQNYGLQLDDLREYLLDHKIVLIHYAQITNTELIFPGPADKELDPDDVVQMMIDYEREAADSKIRFKERQKIYRTKGELL